MKKKELLKRSLTLFSGLLITALGLAIAKRAELGVPPITSVANVISIKYTFLSLGNWLILFNYLLVVVQIILLRKRFRPIALFQLLIMAFFGYFADFWLWVLPPVSMSYPVKLLLVAVGTATIGLGVTLSVQANLVLNTGEATTKAIADVLGKEFADVKVAFDVGCVALAMVLSLLFFDMKIIGLREGTAIIALFTGVVVKFFTGIVREPIKNWLVK